MSEAATARMTFVTAIAAVSAVAAADVAAAAAPGPRAVALAARHCGLQGIRAHREGRRGFALETEEDATTTTVTVEEGPISPERERRIEAESEKAGRPLRCLDRWGRQNRLRLRWMMPPLGPIYD
ncbi:MAG: hypothetical protein QOE79_1555 [Sphingomonadales bacterium]|nr:hypothetical protein [Sphingomonadales bacterium]